MAVPGDHLTTDELAALLGVQVDTIYRYETSPEGFLLTSKKTGRHRVYNLASAWKRWSPDLYSVFFGIALNAVVRRYEAGDSQLLAELADEVRLGRIDEDLVLPLPPNHAGFRLIDDTRLTLDFRDKELKLSGEVQALYQKDNLLAGIINAVFKTMRRDATSLTFSRTLSDWKPAGPTEVLEVHIARDLTLREAIFGEAIVSRSPVEDLSTAFDHSVSTHKLFVERMAEASLLIEKMDIAAIADYLSKASTDADLEELWEELNLSWLTVLSEFENAKYAALMFDSEAHQDIASRFRRALLARPIARE